MLVLSFTSSVASGTLLSFPECQLPYLCNGGEGGGDDDDDDVIVRDEMRYSL